MVSDVAIVLGSNDAARPAERAAALYRGGQVRKLLFSGGYNSVLGGIEAEEMAARARAAGVPAEAILIEPSARHTDENLQFARSLIGACPSILLVTIQFHLARALIAARRYFPEPADIGWSCYPSRHYSGAEWTTSPRGRADVDSELKKIARYYGVAPDPAP